MKSFRFKPLAGFLLAATMAGALMAAPAFAQTASGAPAASAAAAAAAARSRGRRGRGRRRRLHGRLRQGILSNRRRRRRLLLLGRRRQFRRHRLDADLFGAGPDDDHSGPGAVLRRHGAQEEHPGHPGPELRRHLRHHRAVDGDRLLDRLHRRRSRTPGSWAGSTTSCWRP